MGLSLLFLSMALFLNAETTSNSRNASSQYHPSYATESQIVFTDHFLRSSKTINKPDEFNSFAIHPSGDLYGRSMDAENPGIFLIDPETGEATLVSDFSNFADMTFLNSKDLVLVNNTRLVVLDLENDTRRNYDFESSSVHTGGVAVDPQSGNIIVARNTEPYPVTTILELNPSSLTIIASTNIELPITDIAYDENNVLYGLIRNEVHSIYLQTNASIRVIDETAEELFGYSPVNDNLHNVSPSLHFGKIESGKMASISLPVMNSGADNLIIEAVQFPNQTFTTDAELPLNIPAGESFNLPITFHPAEVTDYEEIIYLSGTFENVDWLDSVRLSGEGFSFNTADAETFYGISGRSLFKIDPVSGVSEELSQLRYIPDAITQTTEDTMYMVSKGVLYKVDPISGGLDEGRVLIPGLDKINYAFRKEITSITSAPGGVFYIIQNNETNSGASPSYSAVLHKYDYSQDSLYSLSWLDSDSSPIMARGAAFHAPTGNVYLSYNDALYIYKSKDSVVHKVGQHDNVFFEDLFFDKNYQLYGISRDSNFNEFGLTALNRHNAKTFTLATLDRHVADGAAGDLSDLAGTFPDYLITALPTEKHEDILVFPNPFTDGLEIKLNSPYKVFLLTIFDSSGKQIFHKEYYDHSGTSIGWNGKDKHGLKVAPGMYTLQIALPDNQITFKVLKKQ